MTTPQVLLDGLIFLEGPRWYDGRLWFSDMFAGKVMTVDMSGNSTVVTEVAERPSGLAILRTAFLSRASELLPVRWVDRGVRRSFS